LLTVCMKRKRPCPSIRKRAKKAISFLKVPLPFLLC
jgi:hypothetical protein